MDDIDVRDSDIAVIGMAGQFPGAKNVEQFWDNIKRKIHSISFFSDVVYSEKSATCD